MGMTMEAREAKKCYKRQYRSKNRDRINAQQRVWNARNRDKLKEYQRKSSLQQPGRTNRQQNISSCLWWKAYLMSV